MDRDQLTGRSRERTIIDIIEQVSIWRKLYFGIQVEGIDKPQRYDLEEAATILQMKKKTLDDYLLQLRQGKTLGFNFEENRNSKVGVLRKFVRENEKELRDKKKIRLQTKHAAIAAAKAAARAQPRKGRK